MSRSDFDAFFKTMHSHLLELEPDTDGERIRRIGQETLRAFRDLAHVRRAVSIFGSAKEAPVGRWGASARELASRLARAGFAVITGGGPGLMAAANEGAASAATESIGLTIDLPGIEQTNEHLTLEVPFHYFFLRKFMFVKYSCGFVCLPGGYGTLDELFEALNLVRTHKLAPFPIILFGSRYWSGLADWLRTTAVEAGTLRDDDLAAFVVTDDLEGVVSRLEAAYVGLVEQLGLDGRT